MRKKESAWMVIRAQTVNCAGETKEAINWRRKLSKCEIVVHAERRT